MTDTQDDSYPDMVGVHVSANDEHWRFSIKDDETLIVEYWPSADPAEFRHSIFQVRLEDFRKAFNDAHRPTDQLE